MRKLTKTRFDLKKSWGEKRKKKIELGANQKKCPFAENMFLPPDKFWSTLENFENSKRFTVKMLNRGH